MTTKETRQIDSMGYVIRHDENYAKDMLGAYRANPNNLDKLGSDWIGEGIAWSAAGMEITVAGYTYEGVLVMQHAFAATNNPNEGVVFEDLAYDLQDPNDYEALFDGFDNTEWLNTDLSQIAYWKIVSVVGSGTVYRAYAPVTSTRGSFPHTIGTTVLDTSVTYTENSHIGLFSPTTTTTATTGEAVPAYGVESAASALLASATRSITFDVPMGQQWNIAFQWVMTSATSNSPTLSYAKMVNGTVSAMSEESLAWTTAAVSTFTLAPFAPIGPGNYQISFANGTVNVSTVAILSQRIA